MSHRVLTDCCCAAAAAGQQIMAKPHWTGTGSSRKDSALPAHLLLLPPGSRSSSLTRTPAASSASSSPLPAAPDPVRGVPLSSPLQLALSSSLSGSPCGVYLRQAA